MGFKKDAGVPTGMSFARPTPASGGSRMLVLPIALILLGVAASGCMDAGDGDGEVTELRFDEHPEHGSILVDGDGHTLYIFLNDEPGSSDCFDQCADNWPPLIADVPPETPADLEGRVSLIDREGQQQVAHDERPLYYFIGDEEPGDANGEGLNDVWFVVRETADGA